MGAVVDGGEDLVEGTGEELQESRRVKKVADPTKPSAREVEEHEFTHLPYRNWCWTCVHGKGKNSSHVRKKEEKTVRTSCLWVRKTSLERR